MFLAMPPFSSSLSPAAPPLPLPAWLPCSSPYSLTSSRLSVALERASVPPRAVLGTALCEKPKKTKRKTRPSRGLRTTRPKRLLLLSFSLLEVRARSFPPPLAPCFSSVEYAVCCCVPATSVHRHIESCFGGDRCNTIPQKINFSFRKKSRRETGDCRKPFLRSPARLQNAGQVEYACCCQISEEDRSIGLAEKRRIFPRGKIRLFQTCRGCENREARRPPRWKRLDANLVHRSPRS